jgi:hypothetical protein
VTPAMTIATRSFIARGVGRSVGLVHPVVP